MPSLSVLVPSALAALVLVVFYSFLIPPKHFPKNIPTIPFFVTLIALFKDVDQAEIYRRYLEKPLATHGAVKIFFGARWNILVERPEFVAEMFKKEDVYAKSGNQKKIPYSVLAEYTGDNIISSHGENWKLYQSVIKPGLQRNFEVQPILKNAKVLIQLLLDEQVRSEIRSVIVPQLLQRYTLANLAESILNSDFQTLQRSDAPLQTLQLAIKREIFKPTFLNFPFLDLCGLPSRQRARKLAHVFAEELCKTVLNSHRGLSCDLSTDQLGSRMIAARETGLLTERQFQHNMISIFLAGHENPQLLLTSLIFLLGKHQDTQQRLREEVLATGVEEPDQAVFQDMPYLTSVIYETLRMYPPISQLINRRTSEAVVLGGEIPIPAGTYMGYNAYSTGRDRKAWGETADEFRPERWGATMEEIGSRYRRANSRAEFISFHGGRRACLGQKFAMLETRVTVFELVRKLRWETDPSWVEKMTPAGPLYPRLLRVKFEEVKGDGL